MILNKDQLSSEVLNYIKVLEDKNRLLEERLKNAAGQYRKDKVIIAELRSQILDMNTFS